MDLYKDTRSEVVPIRVTPAELTLIREKAGNEFRPISQWARLRLLEAIGALPQQAHSESEVTR